MRAVSFLSSVHRSVHRRKMRSVALAFDTPILEQFHIRWPPPQWDTHCEGTGEHGCILDLRLIFERVFRRQPKSLYDRRPGSHEVAGLVQPTFSVQSPHFHNECVILPVPSRIAVPGGIILQKRTTVGRDDPNAMLGFRQDHNIAAVLQYFERKGRKDHPRHTVHVALADRIAFTMLIVIDRAFAHAG